MCALVTGVQTCALPISEILPDLYARGIRPDLLTDQTSAHDPVNGYLPIGWSVADWVERRESDPESVAKAAKASMAVHVRAMLDFQAGGCRRPIPATTSARWRRDRKSVVQGKSVSVRVDLGGRRILNKKTN